MKKINILFSTLVIALVVLVLSSTAVVPAMQLNAKSLKVASATGAEITELFDDKGRYQIDKDDLTFDKTYNFFGYDWHLMIVNGNVATFWMATPYATTYFNKPTRAANVLYNSDGANVWANGYTKTVWNSNYYTGEQPNGEVVIGESAVRKYLNDAAKTMIDNKNYKNKVVAGYIRGNNQENTTAKQVVRDLKFADSGLDNVTRDDFEQNQLTAYYNLDNSDRLWLPSISDLRVWGIVDDTNTVVSTKENLVKWTESTISEAAWLRNADENESEYAAIVLRDATFQARWINNEAGVRPAIHLNITDISTEYQEHLKDATNNNGKNGWWNEKWLQVLFFVVCSVGVLGVILVIIAVIARNRKVSADK